MLRLLTPSLALTVLLLGGLGVAAGTGAITGDVVLVAAALALALWGNTIMVSFRTAAIAAQSTGRFLKITIAGQVSLVFGAALLLAFSVAAPAVWLSLYGGVFLLPTAVALLSARPKTKGHDQERAATRRLGLRLAPTVVANMVMLRSDRLLLPVLSDPTQLGLYIVVAAVTELIAWPVQNYVDGRVPLWRRALVAGSFPAGRLLGGAALFGVGGVAVVGSILTVLLVPLFGGDYSAARSLIWPLAIASGLYAFSRFGVAMTVAANRSSLAASIDVSGMLVAAFAYVVLIPSHGALGAAVGSLLGYGIAALASTLAVVRLYRRDVPEQVLAD